MKTWRLISGIINCALFLRIVYQSFAAGILNFIVNTGQSSGTVGLLTGGMMLAGGILSIIFRKGGKEGNISILILFALGGLIGILWHGNYLDLILWSAWSEICAIVAAVALASEYGHKDSIPPENMFNIWLFCICGFVLAASTIAIYYFGLTKTGEVWHFLFLMGLSFVFGIATYILAEKAFGIK